MAKGERQSLIFDSEFKPRLVFPYNWSRYVQANMVEALDPAEFVEKYCLTFRVYHPPIVNYFATSSRGAYRPGSPIGSVPAHSFFFPKNSIREQIQHSYNEYENALADAIKGGKEIVKGAISGVQGALNLLPEKWRGGSQKGLLFEEPTYFTNTERRIFNITLNLYATSDINEVYEPIRFFKKYSHAGRATLAKDETIGSGVLNKVEAFTFPSTFTIEGALFGSLSNPNVAISPNSISRRHMILKSVVSTYNPGDIQFLKEGYPMHAQLDLEFEDVHSLFSQDWEGSELKVSVTENQR